MLSLWSGPIRWKFTRHHEKRPAARIKKKAKHHHWKEGVCLNQERNTEHQTLRVFLNQERNRIDMQGAIVRL